MRKILVFLIVYFFYSPSYAYQLSENVFVPNSILQTYNSLSKEHKIKYCEFNKYKTRFDIIDKDLPQRIKGFNSRMDNIDEVEGGQFVDVFQQFSKATIFMSATDDQILKERLFDKLFIWASNDALTKTKPCYSSDKQKNLKSKDCKSVWKDKDGQDPAIKFDDASTLFTILNLNYIYDFYFKRFKIEDNRHKIINKWFKSFYKRIPNQSINDFYGHQGGWSFPNVFIKHSQHKKYKNNIKKVLKGMNKELLKDGSFKDRTTRGNRALHYHNQSLAELFLVIEMAYAANLDLPKNMETKLLKAVQIFHEGYLDPMSIEPWAKKKYNSQPSNGNQVFRKINRQGYASGWFHIFQVRYPDHEISKWLKKVLVDSSSLKNGLEIGIGIGCIYNAVANN